MYTHTHIHKETHMKCHLPKDGTSWQAADKRCDILTAQGLANYNYTKKHTWNATCRKMEHLDRLPTKDVTSWRHKGYSITHVHKETHMKCHLPKDGTSWQAADKRWDILTAQGLANYTCTQRNKCHLPKVDSTPSTNRNACNTTPAKFRTSLQATPF